MPIRALVIDDHVDVANVTCELLQLLGCKTAAAFGGITGARLAQERIDAIAANTVPGLRRAVKWGMSYYGVGDGWCFSCGAFATHVKLMFINGAALSPVPPVTPVAMGKSTRGIELESLDDILWDIDQALDAASKKA